MNRKQLRQYEEKMKQARAAFYDTAKENPDEMIRIGQEFLDIFEKCADISYETFIKICEESNFPVSFAMQLIEHARIHRGQEGQNRTSIVENLK